MKLQPGVSTSHIAGLGAEVRGRLAVFLGFLSYEREVALMSSSGPIDIAILDDVDLVSRGLEELCGRADREFRVHNITSDASSTGPVDIVLYDGFTTMREGAHNASELLRIARARHLVIYSWNVKRVLVEAALRGGASGYLDKRLGFEELTEALAQVHNGDRVVRVATTPPPIHTPGQRATRPADLGQREAEIVALIAQGLGNQEISEQLYLSINTIKSYVRSAYRKMRVETRVQAVLWAIDHGLVPEPDWSPDERLAV
jgi:DNA-binding NarL/FixJ family response regulator